MNWVFGVHSLWRDTLFSLDTGGRAFVLPQVMCQTSLLSMGGLTLSEKWMEYWVGGVGGGERSERELGLVCKIRLFIKLSFFSLRLKFAVFLMSNKRFWKKLGTPKLRNKHRKIVESIVYSVNSASPQASPYSCPRYNHILDPSHF